MRRRRIESPWDHQREELGRREAGGPFFMGGLGLPAFQAGKPEFYAPAGGGQASGASSLRGTANSKTKAGLETLPGPL